MKIQNTKIITMNMATTIIPMLVDTLVEEFLNNNLLHKFTDLLTYRIEWICKSKKNKYISTKFSFFPCILVEITVIMAISAVDIEHHHLHNKIMEIIIVVVIIFNLSFLHKHIMVNHHRNNKYTINLCPMLINKWDKYHVQ